MERCRVKAPLKNSTDTFEGFKTHKLYLMPLTKSYTCVSHARFTANLLYKSALLSKLSPQTWWEKHTYLVTLWDETLQSPHCNIRYLCDWSHHVLYHLFAVRVGDLKSLAKITEDLSAIMLSYTWTILNLLRIKLESKLSIIMLGLTKFDFEFSHPEW